MSFIQKKWLFLELGTSKTEKLTLTYYLEPEISILSYFSRINSAVFSYCNIKVFKDIFLGHI